MTIEELEALLKQAADPNSAPEALATLREKVSEIITVNGTLASQHAEDEKTIGDLRDVNMRMFLRTGSEPTGDNSVPEEETPEQVTERLRNMYFNKED